MRRSLRRAILLLELVRRAGGDGVVEAVLPRLDDLGRQAPMLPVLRDALADDPLAQVGVRHRLRTHVFVASGGIEDGDPRIDAVEDLFEVLPLPDQLRFRFFPLRDVTDVGDDALVGGGRGERAADGFERAPASVFVAEAVLGCAHRAGRCGHGAERLDHLARVVGVDEMRTRSVRRARPPPSRACAGRKGSSTSLCLRRR